MDLTEKNCVPCEGGVPALDEGEIRAMLSNLSGWQVSSGGAELRKRYQFPGFKEAVAFVGRLAELAESEGHHPDFCVGYDKVDVVLTTHAIGGLSENDFIVAAKLDRLT